MQPNFRTVMKRTFTVQRFFYYFFDSRTKKKLFNKNFVRICDIGKIKNNGAQSMLSSF